MDPVTHLTSGALQGQLFRKSFGTRWIFLFCGIAALLPDADNLTGLFNPEFYLIHHRGITHSLAGAVLASAARSRPRCSRLGLLPPEASSRRKTAHSTSSTPGVA